MSILDKDNQVNQWLTFRNYTQPYEFETKDGILTLKTKDGSFHLNTDEFNFSYEREFLFAVYALTLMETKQAEEAVYDTARKYLWSIKQHLDSVTELEQPLINVKVTDYHGRDLNITVTLDKNFMQLKEEGMGIIKEILPTIALNFNIYGWKTSVSSTIVTMRKRVYHGTKEQWKQHGKSFLTFLIIVTLSSANKHFDNFGEALFTIFSSLSIPGIIPVQDNPKDLLGGFDHVNLVPYVQEHTVNKKGILVEAILSFPFNYNHHPKYKTQEALALAFLGERDHNNRVTWVMGNYDCITLGVVAKDAVDLLKEVKVRHAEEGFMDKFEKQMGTIVEVWDGQLKNNKMLFPDAVFEHSIGELGYMYQKSNLYEIHRNLTIAFNSFRPTKKGILSSFFFGENQMPDSEIDEAMMKLIAHMTNGLSERFNKIYL